MPAIVYSTKHWNQVQPQMVVQGSVVFDFLEKNKPSNTSSVQEMVCSDGQCQINPSKNTEPCKIEEWNDEWNSNYSDSYAFLDNTEEGMCHNFQFLDDLSLSENYDLTNVPMRSSPTDPFKNKIKDLPQSSDNNHSSSTVNNPQSYSQFPATDPMLTNHQPNFNTLSSDFNQPINQVSSSYQPIQSFSSSSNTMDRQQVDISKKMIDLPDFLQPIDSKQAKANENDLMRSVEQLKQQRNSI